MRRGSRQEEEDLFSRGVTNSAPEVPTEGAVAKRAVLLSYHRHHASVGQWSQSDGETEEWFARSWVNIVPALA